VDFTQEGEDLLLLHRGDPLRQFLHPINYSSDFAKFSSTSLP
jgi:D-alanyl-D-alanine carboxypeptidase